MQAFGRPTWWSAHHPVERGVLLFGLLLIALASQTIASALMVLLVVSSIAILSGVQWFTWLRLLWVPTVFVVMSIAPFAIATSDGGATVLVPGWSLAGALHGLRLGVRALAASSCVLLFATSTPLHVIALMLRRFRAPALVTDSVLLTGRLVSVARARFSARQRAAAVRLGAVSWRARWRTSGLLAASLLLDMMQQARRLELGLEARGGFTTDSAVNPSWVAPSRLRLGLACAVLVAVSVLTVSRDLGLR